MALEAEAITQFAASLWAFPPVSKLPLARALAVSCPLMRVVFAPPLNLIEVAQGLPAEARQPPALPSVVSKSKFGCPAAGVVCDRTRVWPALRVTPPPRFQI